MIDIRDIELKMISRALNYGDHTDVFLLTKHFLNKDLADIWEEIKDSTEINVLDMTKRFDENLLGDIISNIPSYGMTPKQCSELIIEDYTKREFLKEIDVIKGLVSAGVAPEKAMKQLSDMETSNLSSNEPEDALTVLRRVYNDIDLMSRGEKESTVFIPTGMAFYDDTFFGVERDAYTIIAARSSMGKTAFGMNIASTIASRGHSVLVISLEMSSESLAYRMLSSHGKTDLQLLKKGIVQKENGWAGMSALTAKLANGKGKLAFDDSPRLTASQLIAKVRRYKKKHGLDVLLIDYIGLMDAEEKGLKKHEYVSEISKVMPGIAKENNIALIALAQIGRAAEQRPNKRPMMSDLRDSGQLEMDADAIIMLYREEYYNKLPVNEGVAEIIMQKQRNGPTGTVFAAFNKEYASFADLDEEKKYKYIAHLNARKAT